MVLVKFDFINGVFHLISIQGGIFAEMSMHYQYYNEKLWFYFALGGILWFMIMYFEFKSIR